MTRGGRVGRNFVHVRPQSNNQSGILGVCIEEAKGYRGDYVVAYCGRERQRFSVRTLGWRKALALAKQARAEMVKRKLSGKLPKLRSEDLYIKVSQQGARWSGYFVQVPPGPAKLFSLSRYVDEKAALAAARRYRDKMVKQYDVPAKNGWWVHRRAQANNKVGVLGVCEMLRNNGRGRPKQRAFVAHCVIDGRQVKRYFSIAEHGRKRALALAIAARAELIAQRLASAPPPRRRVAYNLDPGARYRGQIEGDGSVRMRNYNGDTLRGTIEPDGYGCTTPTATPTACDRSKGRVAAIEWQEKERRRSKRRS